MDDLGWKPTIFGNIQKGHQIWEYLVSGFHLYLGGPKTYRSVPWSSIEPWKGLLQAVDDQIVFHPGQELWSLRKYYLLVAGGWIGGWLYLLGKRWFSRKIHKGQKGKHHGRSLSRWWQLNYFLEFSSRTLGKMNPFWVIFFRWVETTNQISLMQDCFNANLEHTPSNLYVYRLQSGQDS